MRVRDVLEKVYGLKKDGSLKHHAINFCTKNNLDIEGDYNETFLAVIFSRVSNKDKREEVIQFILENTTTSKSKTDIGVLRKESYKKCCKIFHPDNKDTGDEYVFKFIQDVKEAFWCYNGEPRKSIKHRCWDNERKMETDPDYYKKWMRGEL